MRTLALLLALSAEPIPAARHESVSRAMLRVSLAHLRVLTLREQQTVNTDELRAAERELLTARSLWTAMQEQLRKEFSAAGCEITVDKTWDCKENH